MLRSTALIISLLFLASCLAGQIDVKMDPLSLAFSKNIKGGVEIGVEDKIGIDVDILYSKSINLPIIDFSIAGESWGTRLIGKYYFEPKYGLDQFYAGPYFKYRRNFGKGFIHQRAAMGIIGGIKFFTFDNFYIDMGFGIGARVFSSLKNPVGDFIDNQIGAPTIEDFWDRLTNRFGRADFTSRLLIGYRIDGYGPRARKQQEAEIKP